MPKIQDNSKFDALLTDFATKLRDTEERHDLLKDRVDLLNQTFLKQEKRVIEEIITVKDTLRGIKEDLEKIRESLRSIVSESAGFARKEELGMLDRYMKLWEPLKFVKADEVGKIVDEKLKEKGYS